jgi:hypothetical protein
MRMSNTDRRYALIATPGINHGTVHKRYQNDG